ncbi:uncharacterized protein [Castor canadensis]|uniref:Uncharacterized protein n=1 Tax=Castor canadensis TaxID=51338 RepID=A0AC58LG75_CASCN
MEVAKKNTEATGKRSGLGRCRHFFWLGIIFDTVGTVVLFVGVFADLLFYDMLLYLGSIIIFVSLLWWISWYTGNIELPEETTAANSEPSTPAVEALRQSVSHRFSMSIGTVSSTFLRIRRQRRIRRVLQRTAHLNAAGQQEKDSKGTEEEGSGAPQDVDKESVPVTPQDGKGSEAAGSSGPPAGRSTPVVHPVSPLDQPKPCPVQGSKSLPVVSLGASHQLLSISASKSQPTLSMPASSQLAVTLVLASQPAVPVVSPTHPAVPVVSLQSHPPIPVTSRQPEVPMTSRSYPLVSVVSAQSPFGPVSSKSFPQVHCLVPVAAQSHPLAGVDCRGNLLLSVASQSLPLVPVTSQSHIQVPLTSEDQLSNPPVDSQSQRSSVQTVQPQASPSIKNFRAPFHIHRTSQNIPVVQNPSQSQSSHGPGVSQMKIAPPFQSVPLLSQKPTQEPPDTVSPTPEAQQSLTSDSAPAEVAEKKSHPL